MILWDRGLEGGEDDRLLLAREVYDPPIYPGRIGYPSGVFENNAERVDVLKQQLWTNPLSDSDYMGIFVNGIAFKTVSWSSYLQDIEVEKIKENWDDGTYLESDLIDMSTVMGSSMGTIHSTTKSFSGQNSGAVIIDDIQQGGSASVLHQEVLETSLLEQQQLMQQYAAFQQYLMDRGPLLEMVLQ